MSTTLSTLTTSIEWTNIHFFLYSLQSTQWQTNQTKDRAITTTTKQKQKQNKKQTTTKTNKQTNNNNNKQQGLIELTRRNDSLEDKKKNTCWKSCFSVVCYVACVWFSLRRSLNNVCYRRTKIKNKNKTTTKQQHNNKQTNKQNKKAGKLSVSRLLEVHASIKNLYTERTNGENKIKINGAESECSTKTIMTKLRCNVSLFSYHWILVEAVHSSYPVIDHLSERTRHQHGVGSMVPQLCFPTAEL